MVIGGVANTYCIAPVAGGPYFVLVVYNKASDGKIKVAKLDPAWVYASQVDMAETAGALYPPNGFGACCTAGEKVYVTHGWDPNDGSGQRCKLARLDYTTWTLDGGFPLIVNAPGVFANKGAAIPSLWGVQGRQQHHGHDRLQRHVRRHGCCAIHQPGYLAGAVVHQVRHRYRHHGGHGKHPRQRTPA